MPPQLGWRAEPWSVSTPRASTVALRGIELSSRSGLALSQRELYSVRPYAGTRDRRPVAVVGDREINGFGPTANDERGFTVEVERGRRRAMGGTAGGQDGERERAGQEAVARQVRCDLQVPVTVGASDEARVALTENISAGGVFVATSTPGRVGDRLVLDFKLPNAERVISIDGEIRWVRTTPSAQLRHGARGMGLQFTAVSFAAAALVRAFLESRGPVCHTLR